MAIPSGFMSSLRPILVPISGAAARRYEAMLLHLKIYQERDDCWLFMGLPGQPVRHFKRLPEGLETAKRECFAAPAVIELYVDGLYIGARQKSGWPHELCRPVKYLPTPVASSRLHRVRNTAYRCFG